jgi:hypothetical protein
VNAKVIDIHRRRGAPPTLPVEGNSYLAILGNIDLPTEILTEMISGGAMDSVRFGAIADNLSRKNVTVVRRESFVTVAAVALLGIWDEDQGELYLSSDRGRALAGPHLVPDDDSDPLIGV